MTQAQRVNELADMLRICSEKGGCRKCPLDHYIGNCREKLDLDSAEMLEDQQAIIDSLSGKLSGMIADIKKLQDKYSGGAHGQKEEAGG